MKPAPFKYYAPETLDETLALLATYGLDATVLAGGQSLVPTMNFRLAQPEVLIDINGVQALSFLREASGDTLLLGAMTRHSMAEKSTLVQRRAPLLFEAMPCIAHPPIRNRGTLGGSLAHADPSAELPAITVALQARFRLRSQSNDRWVDAKDFFRGLFFTAREPDELLSEIEIPAQPKAVGSSFLEIARRHGDYALVGVAAVVSLDDNRQCREARLVYLSVGEGPVVADSAMKLLVGNMYSDDLIEEAAFVASSQDVDPRSDLHASAAYRRHLVNTLTTRALKLAFRRALSSFS